MKKLLSILLAVLLIGGTMGVAASAAAPALPKAASLSPLLKPLTDFIAKYDLENLTQVQLDLMIKILQGLKKLNIDYAPLLESLDEYLPFAVKAALHDAGLMEYPVWERDMILHFVFRYLLFGWLWME